MTGPWTPANLGERVDPAHTALLLIDLQNDTCAPGFEADRRGRDISAIQAMLPAAARLLAAARRAGTRVVHVGFANPPDFGPDDGPWMEQRRKADAIGLSLAGSRGAAFLDAVKPWDAEQRIWKPRNSSFKGTDLDGWLRARSVRSLVLCGQGTNVCVESTAREAFDLGYFITIAEDAVASALPHLHAAALETLALRFATVAPVAALEAAWARTAI